jgi:hypothetical protein
MAAKLLLINVGIWLIYVLALIFQQPRWSKLLRLWRHRLPIGSEMLLMIAYNVFMVFHSQVKKNLTNIFILKKKLKSVIIELLVVLKNFLIIMNFHREVRSSILMVQRFIINLQNWSEHNIVSVVTKRFYRQTFLILNCGRLQAIIPHIKKIFSCGKLKVKGLEWNPWIVQDTVSCLIIKLDHLETYLWDLLTLEYSIEMKYLVLFRDLLEFVASNKMTRIFSALQNNLLMKWWVFLISLIIFTEFSDLHLNYSSQLDQKYV